MVSTLNKYGFFRRDTYFFCKEILVFFCYAVTIRFWCFCIQLFLGELIMRSEKPKVENGSAENSNCKMRKNCKLRFLQLAPTRTSSFGDGLECIVDSIKYSSRPED